MEPSSKRKVLLNTFFGALITLIYISPLIWIFLTSLKSRNDIFAMPPEWLFIPTLKNYISTLTDPQIISNFLNSFLLTATSVFLALVLTLFAAYAFSRYKIPGSENIQFIILSLRMLPPITVVIPMFLLYRAFNLANTYIGMILLYTMFSIPFSLWMLKNFIDDIPVQMDEMALRDGASIPRLIKDIILPQIGPAVVSVVLFNAIFVWNDFVFAYILTGPNTRTIPVAISLGLWGESGIDWEFITSMGVTYIMPLILLAFTLRDRLLAGMTFGTVRR